jgi:hypothetical protein
VHCIDRRTVLGAGVTLWLAGCSSPMPRPVSPMPPGPAPAAPPGGRMARPEAARNWTELRLIAARRLMLANPGITYDGPSPDPLLAIPVLEVELYGDGSIRRIDVLRYPRQAKDTVQIAIDAMRRAAPFGDVSRLPRPWKFTETFLFNDDRKFKPRTLDV